MKHASSKRCRRRGHTLLEMMVSVSLYATLAAGMTSVIAICGKTLELSHSGAARVAEAARVSERIAQDLRLALRFSERTADATTFTVPDRDGDGDPETVRYAWTGSPDYQVTQLVRLSGSPVPATPQVIAEDVRQFHLDYLLRTWGTPRPPAELESDEVLLVSHDDRPEGDGRRCLFVVTNPGAPTAQEAVRHSWLQSWGFTVQLVGASADATALDTALAASDVVYISQQVNASALGATLANPSVGVVHEKADLADDYGFALQAGTSPDRQVLDLSCATHYVSAPWLPGALNLFSSGQPVTWLSEQAAQQSPDLLVLGGWAGAPSLAVLEAGAEKKMASSQPGVLGSNAVYSAQTATGDLPLAHVATKTLLPSDARVSSLKGYVTLSVRKSMRFGIYRNNNGEPGALVAQTATTSLGAGSSWRTLPLPRPVLLPAGTYWLAMGMYSESKYNYEAGTGQTRHALSGTDPADGLMPAWSGTVQSNARSVSLYADYQTTGITAGRRVQLPWGALGFDAQSLTDQAKAILRHALEWAADQSPGDSSEPCAVTTRTYPAQYFLPALPANAVRWKVTRMMVPLRKVTTAGADATVTFQLRQSDAARKPGSILLQSTAAIPVTTWDALKWNWYQVPFNEEGDVIPTTGLCLVWKASQDSAVELKLDRGGVPMTANTHFTKSQDGGASWSAPDATQDLRFYVYGTYITTGPPQW